MLNIPEKGVFEFTDISYDKMKDFHTDFALKICAITRDLKKMTGIGGNRLNQGLDWDLIKQTVMSN